VALDLDGTLMGADQKIAPAVATAVRSTASAGVRVVLATGRAYPSVRPFQARLGLSGPVICYQGADVRDGMGNQLFLDALPPGALSEAAAIAEGRGDELTFYADDCLYVTAIRHPDEFYERWFGLPRRVVAAWSQVPPRPTKFLLIAGCEAEGDSMAAAWRGAVPGVQIVRSHPLFVEGVAAGVSKAKALGRLATGLGIPRARVMAVGDNENDAEMLAWAGLGVAMGGAPKAVAARADVQAPSLAQDGAAWALRRYLRSGGA
jgi:hypothetical protein